MFSDNMSVCSAFTFTSHPLHHIYYSKRLGILHDDEIDFNLVVHESIDCNKRSDITQYNLYDITLMELITTTF